MADVYLGRTLGEGGFSHVVAIKRILEGHCRDKKFCAMFRSEAELSSRLNHRNVVPVLDFDRDENGRLFLVMPFVDGVHLGKLIRTQGLLPLEVVLYVGHEVLRGLAYAHELPRSGDKIRGLVHRDISPGNILLSWHGDVRVADFGIAKVREATGVDATKSLKGKPSYMSPEQIRGRKLDGRSDLFAVGVVLWEMLCRRQLFRQESEVATMHSVLSAPAPPPSARRPDTPPDLERVVMRLLAKEREGRYATAAEAAAALGECEHFPRNGSEFLERVLEERFAELTQPVVEVEACEVSEDVSSSEIATLAPVATAPDTEVSPWEVETVAPNAAKEAYEVVAELAAAEPVAVAVAAPAAVVNVVAVTAPPAAVASRDDRDPYLSAAAVIAAEVRARAHQRLRYALRFAAGVVIAGAVTASILVAIRDDATAIPPPAVSPNTTPIPSTRASTPNAGVASQGSSQTPPSLPEGSNAEPPVGKTQPTAAPVIPASAVNVEPSPPSTMRKDVGSPPGSNGSEKRKRAPVPVPRSDSQDRIHIFDTTGTKDQ